MPLSLVPFLKDNMYRNLKLSIQGLLTTIPKQDKNMVRSSDSRCWIFSNNTMVRYLRLITQQPWTHDDYPDSWALAEWAYAKWSEKQSINSQRYGISR